MRSTFAITAILVAVAALGAARGDQNTSKTVPLPLAAQAAANKARSAIAEARKQYENEVIRIRKREIAQLQVAEQAAMHAGNLAQAEAVQAKIKGLGGSLNSGNFKAYWGWLNHQVDVTNIVRPFVNGNTIQFPEHLWLGPWHNGDLFTINFHGTIIRMQGQAKDGMLISVTK